LVTARTSSRKTAICTQPLTVISEFLRTQQRVKEIDHREGANRDHDGGFCVHGSPLLHAVAEVHVPQRQNEESNGDGYKDDILHALSPTGPLFTAELPGQGE
jgi:hypothetical protein